MASWLREWCVTKYTYFPIGDATSLGGGWLVKCRDMSAGVRGHLREHAPRRYGWRAKPKHREVEDCQRLALWVPSSKAAPILDLARLGE